MGLESEVKSMKEYTRKLESRLIQEVNNKSTSNGVSG